MLFKKLVVLFVVLNITSPGFSEQNRMPLKKDYNDQREYIRDALLFFTSMEGAPAEDQSERSSTDYITQKRAIFAPANTSLLKDLFENDLRLSHWMKTSSAPLFAAIQADNVDMIQFFETKQESVLVKKYNNIYPVQLAVIVPSIKAMRFFFNHPAVNLDVVNMFGDNLFHVIFLGVGPEKSKLKVAQVFFHNDYFPKVAHLLNIPNADGEAPMDLALREAKTPVTERVALEFLNRKAVPLKQQVLLEQLKLAMEKATKKKKNRHRHSMRRDSYFMETNHQMITGGNISQLEALDRRANIETVRILRRERRERKEKKRVKKINPNETQFPSTCPRGFQN